LFILISLIIFYFSQKIENKTDNNKIKISYPWIEDLDFNSKIETTFKNKLQNKFKIKNIVSKTYDEILSETWNNKNVNKVIEKLKLYKYSWVDFDKKELLKLVKKI
jgi:hypothetical protein